MTTARRAWGQWLRRLGLQQGEGPEVGAVAQPVILVGDESDLREHWHGPRGWSGGLGTSAGGGPVAIEIIAGPTGCYATLSLTSDGAVAERLCWRYDDAANHLQDLAVGTLAEMEVSSADPLVPCRSHIYSYEAVAAWPSWFPNDGTNPLTASDATSTYSNRNARAVIPRSWIAPGRMLSILSQSSHPEFWCQLEEPGDAA